MLCLVDLELPACQPRIRGLLDDGSDGHDDGQPHACMHARTHFNEPPVSARLHEPRDEAVTVVDCTMAQINTGNRDLTERKYSSLFRVEYMAFCSGLSYRHFDIT
ncbi:unnamed protein product [Mesocestoides corti]|uniref:Uncharacterized protein n=1 Tax=Mesocestoides corti TaxID=53468 RepID=A0A0R3U588_MESCO|nr:unnamed protein product [Mesocestoides corti]